MEHDDHYVYGRYVILRTDHKPLSLYFSEAPSISSQKTAAPTVAASAVWPWDLNSSNLADTLSRTYLVDFEHSATEVKVETAFMPPLSFPFQTISLRNSKERQLMTQPFRLWRKQSWTASQIQRTNSHPATTHQYFDFWDELSVHDGIIFKGQWCIILQTLRQTIKQKLHDTHIGVQGCSSRARETVYWSRMNAEITD